MQQQNKLAVPAAIIIAGFLIAASIYLVNREPGGSTLAGQPDKAQAAEIKIRPIDISTDHLRGKPDAPITIVEFSDLECPFCKGFHTTMSRIIEEYAKDGRVAHVYRHFPIDELHSKARAESEATECVNQLLGEEKFWEYLDKIFITTPSNNNLDPAFLPQFAVELGADKKAFESCQANRTFQERVERDRQDAVAGGGLGTPYVVLVLKEKITKDQKELINSIYTPYRAPGQPEPLLFSNDGYRVALGGGFPYNDVKLTLDTLLKVQ